MDDVKPINIEYKNGHEMIFDGEITGFRTMFLFIPLGGELPAEDGVKREFEFPDGTIWEGYIDSRWSEIKWRYGKKGELLGIAQKVSIRYTIKHEGKEAKRRRFNIYEKCKVNKQVDKQPG
jgi:hypothetical protein